VVPIDNFSFCDTLFFYLIKTNTNKQRIFKIVSLELLTECCANYLFVVVVDSENGLLVLVPNSDSVLEAKHAENI